MYLTNLKNSSLSGPALEGNKKYTRNLSKGFTLVEVLVVMAIIATLLGIGVSGMKSMASSKGVSTAVPLADSVFAHARKVAKSGVPTRVVIYSDTSGGNEDIRERYCRMIGIATARNANGEPITDGSAAVEWRLISRPSTLPSNTFFNLNLSEEGGESVDEDSAIFPGDTSPKDCYVYEFNSEGALISATADGSGESLEEARFVVQAGKLLPGSSAEIIPSSSAKRDVGGFRIWANGRLAKFRSPNQIVEGSEDPTFQ